VPLTRFRFLGLGRKRYDHNHCRPADLDRACVGEKPGPGGYSAPQHARARERDKPVSKGSSTWFAPPPIRRALRVQDPRVSDVTDPSTTTGVPTTTQPVIPGPATGRWRWVAALAGALVVSLAVAPVGPLPFYTTPLILGLTYLAAAAAAGRQATLWAPGLIITAWGGAVLLVLSRTLNADFAAVAITALGVGATAAALLGRRGFRVDGIAVGAGSTASCWVCGSWPIWPACPR